MVLYFEASKIFQVPFKVPPRLGRLRKSARRLDDSARRGVWLEGFDRDVENHEQNNTEQADLTRTSISI